MSAVPLKQRWFDDYVVGEVFEFADRLVTAAEIIAFASQYDPQPFHTDPEAAAASSFGGLVASGWMTAALLMRELCEHFISPVSTLGSPGVDQLRWLHPVRPGDRLRMRISVVETRPSRSRSDRGAVVLREEVLNQSGEIVMSMLGTILQRRRQPP